jgi:hypothetical protein
MDLKKKKYNQCARTQIYSRGLIGAIGASTIVCRRWGDPCRLPPLATVPHLHVTSWTQPPSCTVSEFRSGGSIGGGHFGSSDDRETRTETLRV